MAKAPAPEPPDPEYLRIKEVESRTIHIDPEAHRHPLVTATAKAIKERPDDDKGLMSSPRNQPCLRLLVSKETLDRALMIFNGIVTLLEKEGFPVSVDKENHNSIVKIFGQEVAFDIAEKYRQLGMDETTTKTS